jgi:hypothetical protein
VEKQMLKFKRILAGAAMGVVGLAAMAPVHAALLQSTTPSVTTWLDTTLSGVALIYDANFYSATDGRLVIVASGNTLQGPGVPTGTPPGQIYLGAGDQLRDEMLSLRINNSSGALVSGTVSVKPSNDGVANDSWQFVGNVTAFGFADNSGGTTNTFDARFRVNSYNLSDVAQGLVGPGSINPNAPLICAVTDPFCGYGYLRFGTSGIAFTGGVGTGVNFAVDWVRGAGVISGNTPNAQLGTFDDGIATAAYLNNAVTSDIFMTVPVPGAFALFAAGLVGLGPMVRRRARRS